MGFVGGAGQAEYVAAVRAVDPARRLLVPVDVGKTAAMTLVADGHGEVVAEPVTFPLTEPGFARLAGTVAAAAAARDAGSVRVGVETAGAYHWPLVARLVAARMDVVELPPAVVKQARAMQGRGRLKSDVRDLLAMAELLARGAGRAPQCRTDAQAAQLAWVGHRRRKAFAHKVLATQVISQLDVVFPGLGGCFADVLGAKAGRVLLAEFADPDRVQRLGPARLRGCLTRRGVVLRAAKAEQVVTAARDALRLPAAERRAREAALHADLELLAALEADLARADAELAALLPATPAAVLTSLPGVGVVRASRYGAALGDPSRFPSAEHAYRASGLVPASYESAGRARPGQRISREGSVELREAIIELGRGLAGHDADFARYRRALLAAGKRPLVAAIAVGHRAHRLAFAMMRDQTLYDRADWVAGVAAGRTVRARPPAAAGADPRDVARPPLPPTVDDATSLDNPAPASA